MKKVIFVFAALSLILSSYSSANLTQTETISLDEDSVEVLAPPYGISSCTTVNKQGVLVFGHMCADPNGQGCNQSYICR
ncbi:MAG: hypothetical protein JKY54_19475 [Flavobacteriales bacterium]|nr:hypothetical protein [Flavobacteriales bacterium]